MKININTDKKTLKVKGMVSDKDFIKINDNIQYFELDNIKLLIDTSNVTNISRIFEGCSKITKVDVSKFDTSKATIMSWMFYSCSGLTSLDLSNFDTSNVIIIDAMFSHCSGLTSLDLSSFNTDKVACMMYMFYECSGLTSLDLSSFTFENVEHFDKMFYGVPDTCEIIVKSEKEKQWLLDNVYELGLESRNIKIKGE